MNDGVNSGHSPQKSSQKRRVPLPQTRISFTCCDNCGTRAWQHLRRIGLKAHMTCPHTIIVRADEDRTVEALRDDGWNLTTESNQACFEVIKE